MVASSGGERCSTQVGKYAPETRPTSRQHQPQPPKQAAPALHSARSAQLIYLAKKEQARAMTQA